MGVVTGPARPAAGQPEEGIGRGRRRISVFAQNHLPHALTAALGQAP